MYNHNDEYALCWYIGIKYSNTVCTNLTPISADWSFNYFHMCSTFPIAIALFSAHTQIAFCIRCRLLSYIDVWSWIARHFAICWWSGCDQNSRITCLNNQNFCTDAHIFTHSLMYPFEKRAHSRSANRHHTFECTYTFASHLMCDVITASRSTLLYPKQPLRVDV